MIDLGLNQNKIKEIKYEIKEGKTVIFKLNNSNLEDVEIIEEEIKTKDETIEEEKSKDFNLNEIMRTTKPKQLNDYEPFSCLKGEKGMQETLEASRNKEWKDDVIKRPKKPTETGNALVPNESVVNFSNALNNNSLDEQGDLIEKAREIGCDGITYKMIESCENKEWQKTLKEKPFEKANIEDTIMYWDIMKLVKEDKTDEEILDYLKSKHFIICGKEHEEKIKRLIDNRRKCVIKPLIHQATDVEIKKFENVQNKKEDELIKELKHKKRETITNALEESKKLAEEEWKKN